jgi:hypothetical protein
LEDLTDDFSPRAREILLLFKRGGYRSIQDLMRDNPDITPEEVAMVSSEIMKVTGMTPPASPPAGPATCKPRRRDTSPLAYQLKITLAGSKPPIWRRFIVPGDISLDRLHDVIQIVMGWHDGHLHQFEIGDQIFTDQPEQQDLDGYEERDYRLCDLVTREKVKFWYEYDFGDGWRHHLVVEKIEPLPASQRALPCCLKGRRHCPPEDVGGIWGYEEFLEAVADPKHPEHDRYCEWAGEAFDPEAFDVDGVNLELAKHARWSRERG